MFNIRPYLRLNLRLFDVDLNVQTTKSPGLTDGMKTYYEDRLIDYAEPQLVHDQFGDEYNIPKHGGKIIEFRKYLPLPKALNQLIEGVTPKGGKLEMSTLTAEVGQYGYYITISDILELAHVDPQIEQATKMLGSQAGHKGRPHFGHHYSRRHHRRHKRILCAQGFCRRRRNRGTVPRRP